MLHGPEQPLVARDVVHHQRHHFHAQGLPQPARVLAQGGVAGCAAGLGALLAQALHHVVDLVHLLQCLEGGGHGGGEVGAGRLQRGERAGAFELAREALGEVLLRGWCGGWCIGELAQQQAAQAVEREPRVGLRRLWCVFLFLGAEAWRDVAFRGCEIDVLSVGLAHGEAHGADVALPQPFDERQVELAQFVAQGLGQVAHPVVPHLVGGLHLRHHTLQRLQEDLGAQRVVLRADGGQALGRAHEGVEISQRPFYRRSQHLLRTGALDALADLRFIHQFEFVEMDAGQRARGFLLLRDCLVERVAQRGGVALAHHGGQLRQALAGFEHGLVLTGRARHVFARPQRLACGLRDVLHEMPGVGQHVMDQALVQRGAEVGRGGGGADVFRVHHRLDKCAGVRHRMPPAAIRCALAAGKGAG